MENSDIEWQMTVVAMVAAEGRGRDREREREREKGGERVIKREKIK